MIFMARSRSASSRKPGDNKLFVILLIALVAFAAGFAIARAKYKTQLTQTYDMVMEREGMISGLQEKLKNFEKKMMMNEDLNTGY